MSAAGFNIHYQTFFFTSIASMTLYTVCAVLLARYNPQMKGMRWFAASMMVGLAKMMLQSLAVQDAPLLSALVANELYLLQFALQMLALHWFFVRRPVERVWPLFAVAGLMSSYMVLFLLRVPYIGNLLNLPVVALCALSAAMVFRHRKPRFEVPGRVIAGILVGETLVAAYRALLTNLHYSLPWSAASAAGDPRWLFSLLIMVFLVTCMATGMVWLLVTELQCNLREQARTDALTGALNRRALEQEGRREVARSLRQGRMVTVILLDVDHFKLLNDRWGHAGGDLVLRELVGMIRNILRQGDLLARSGGEEFTLLLPDTNAAEGAVVAERLRCAAAGLTPAFAGGEISFTISLGVSQTSPVEQDWEELLRRADLAMYAAKRLGRNRVVTELELERAALGSEETDRHVAVDTARGPRSLDLAPGSEAGA